ncbi:MAG: hypothetical protein VX589_15530 [Myxococcota bacterium]|nr:hypothetical protein [Myxococcota bacterium]
MSQVSRVLMLTASWPPVARVGVRRPLRIARRLAEYGWQPSVMTPTPNAIFRQMPPLDQSLSTPDIPTFRIPALIPSTRVARLLARLPRPIGSVLQTAMAQYLLPDQYPEWTRAAVRAARRLDGFHAVWVTGGPFGMFYVGAAVADALQLPLVLDYRDPWTSDHQPRRMPGAPTLEALRNYEAKLLQRANGVAYVNQDMLTLNMRHFGQPKGAEWAVIPNGFAPEDCPDVEPHSYQRPTVIYAGSCYASRSMLPVLRALKALAQLGRPRPQIMMFGELDAPARAFLETASLDDDFHCGSRISAQEITARMRGADALLLIIGDSHRTALSGKIFDYLQVQRPILGVGPANSSAAQLLADTGTGVWATDEATIMQQLEAIAQRTLTYAPRPARIRPYSADAMTERTVALLEAVRRGT